MEIVPDARVVKIGPVATTATYVHDGWVYATVLPNKPNEEWASVPGFNVQASDQGRIRFKKGGKWHYKTPNPDKRGYCRLRHKGRLMSVHNAVWVAFHGEIPEGKTVDHVAKYGDMFKERSDNGLRNLRLADAIEQRANQRKSSLRRDARPIRVWKSGFTDSMLFSSAGEAALALDLDARCLRSVAKGESHQTKGYVAAFEDKGLCLLPNEVFREVHGRWVSQFGRMLDPRTKAFATTPVATEGNDYAATEDPLTYKKLLFHHLVAEAFPELVSGHRAPGLTLDHIDRNVNNNNASNLAWRTAEEQAINRVYRNTSHFDSVRYSIDIVTPDGLCIHCKSMSHASRVALAHGHVVADASISVGIKRHGSYTVTRGTAKGWIFQPVERK
jgi:hypothetical protein